MFKNLFKKTTPEDKEKKEEEKRVKKEKQIQKLKDRVVELNEKYKDYVDQFILIQTKNKYELAVFKDFSLEDGRIWRRLITAENIRTETIKSMPLNPWGDQLSSYEDRVLEDGMIRFKKLRSDMKEFGLEITKIEKNK